MKPAAQARFTAVVLAAQRAGVVDPLAAAAGVSHKCLVPVDGVALIAHVVAALRAAPGMRRLRIVIEPAAAPAIIALLPPGTHVELVDAADNLADSVLAAARGVSGPIVVTTADNVLLTPAAAAAVARDLAGGSDVVVAMARRADVLAAHAQGQRRFYLFRDDAYSNCNLYGLSGGRALAAAESFRSGGQFAKKPLRMVAAFGVVTVLLMLARRLTLADALARIGRRLGLVATPLVLADGAHAIDVDNERTHRVAAALLATRRGTAELRAAA